MEIKHEQSFSKMIVNIRPYMKRESPFHWHEKIEIIICLNKGFGLLIDGVHYELGVGDIAVVGGQIIHKFNVREDDTNLVIMQISYEVLLKSGIVLHPVWPVIRKDEIDNIPHLREEINNLLDIMLWEKNAGNEGMDAFLHHIYAGFYCLLMRHFQAKHTESSGLQKEKNEFYKIVVYANEHFRENINVQSIAGALYMDRGRLSRLFLKYSGMTLNNYINSLRLSSAQKLIKDGMAVTTAALESGFQSVRTYNNVKKNMNQ